MSNYKNIIGKPVKFLSSNLDNAQGNGQIWYNSTDQLLKSMPALSAWSSGGNMITSRYEIAGFGTQTAAVMAVGGNPAASPIASNLVEEYNGTGFTSATVYPASLRNSSACGTETAGLVFGGRIDPPPSSISQVLTREYDGSSWTTSGDMGTARYGLAGAGIQNSAVAFGGYATTNLNSTEEYNGSSWTAGNAMGTARYRLAGNGTLTAALAAGGTVYPYPGAAQTGVEEYDGTNWTAGTVLPATNRMGARSWGEQTNTILSGGNTASPSYTAAPATINYDGSSWSTKTATLATGVAQQGGSTGTDSTAGLFAGGQTTGATAITGVAQEYNETATVVTGAAWSSAPVINTARYGLRGTGTQTAMIVAGGNVPPNSNTAVAEEWNGSSWTNSTSLPAVVQDGNMTGTETASIYAGGSINPGANPGNTNAYNGSSWTSGGNMNTDVNQYGLVGPSTAAVAFGGYITTGPGRTADVQNYNGSSWTSNPTSLPAVRGLLRTTGTQTATFMAGGNAPPGPQPVTSFSYDGSSFSSEADSLVGMNDHGAWGTSTAAYFMGGDQPTTTGGTGPNSVGNFYYNGTAWATAVSMTTGRGTFGWSKSPNAAGLICGGGPGHNNETSEFTPESTGLNIKTITTS